MFLSSAILKYFIASTSLPLIPKIEAIQKYASGRIGFILIAFCRDLAYLSRLVLHNKIAF